MWDGWVLPRLVERGLGRPIVSVTLRLTGIGESAIAARLGSLLDPDARPSVATYARAEAVDIRIWTHADPEGEGLDGAPRRSSSSPASRPRSSPSSASTSGRVAKRTWPELLAERLDDGGWRLSAVEVGLRGALLGLLGEGLAERLAFGETLAQRPPPRRGAGDARAAGRAGARGGRDRGRRGRGGA